MYILYLQRQHLRSEIRETVQTSGEVAMDKTSKESNPSEYRSKGNSLHKVFVYGTLKKGQPNYFHFNETDHGSAKYIGKWV